MRGEIWLHAGVFGRLGRRLGCLSIASLCLVVGFGSAKPSEVRAEQAPAEIQTYDYHFSSKNFVRFRFQDGHPDYVLFYDENTREWKTIYEGKLSWIPTTTPRPMKRNGLEVIVRQRATFTFAILGKENKPLFIFDSGKTIYNDRLPRYWKNCITRNLNYNGKLYTILTFEDAESSTWLFEHEKQNTLKLSSTFMTGDQLNRVSISSTGYLKVPGARDIDLENLEMEALFQPKPTQVVKDKDGKAQDVLTELDGMLEDFRTQVENSPELPLTESDQKIVNQIYENLMNSGQKSVVLLGQSGVGKTTLIAGLLKLLPRTWRVMNVPREVLQSGTGIVGEIDRRVAIMIQASRMVPVIYIMDELHSLKGLGSHSKSSIDVFQMLKKYLASGELTVVGTDTPEEFQKAFVDDPALRRRFTEIRVPEPQKEELTTKLNNWMKTNDLDLPQPLLQRAVRLARDFDPGMSEPARTVKLFEQIKKELKRAKTTTVTPEIVDTAATKLYGIGPKDPTGFVTENAKDREVLLKKVVDQPQIVNALMDLWSEINLGLGTKRHRSILITGPTGAGKTFSGQAFAKYVLKDPERFLEIDATKYKNGNFDSLLGTTHYSEDAPRGLLPEFLSGRGKGESVIVINEIEKAHPHLIKLLMELLDSGRLQGGDGKTYYLGRCLIVLTSNKGADQIYPRGYGKALTRAELEKRLATFTDKKVRELFLKPSDQNLYDTSENWGVAEVQRIDRAVAAAPASLEGAVEIIRQQADAITTSMKETHQYSISIDPTTLQKIAERFYVPEDGVRSVMQKIDALFNSAHELLVTNFSPEGAEEFILSLAESEGSEIGPDPKLKLVSRAHPEKVVYAEGLLKKPAIGNLFSDPEMMDRLSGLEERLGERVFGQAEAIRSTARAARARALNPYLKTPAFQAYLGPTGIGKTELARALAKELYGDENRFVRFDMGQVKTEHDLKNIFGSDRGIVGSQTMGPFEQALNDFPEGMVIVFDEIGNMGNDASKGNASPYASSKEELLKVFYPMLEEGSWTSPLGKVYRLRNHFIIFTSNEGEEDFQKLPTNDLRQAEWKRLNTKSQVHELLKKHGWPEALLGRMGNNITLFKPLLESEQSKVSEKQVGIALKQLADTYKLKAIELAPDFHEKMAQSFFSHSKGARSIREVAEGAILDLVGTALMDNFSDKEYLKNTTFYFELTDNFAGRYKKKRGSEETRQVQFKLTLKNPDREDRVYTADVTGEANEIRLTETKTARSIAYHEAGHAVMNDPELTGDSLEFVTIRGAGNFGGYARYKPLANKDNPTRETAVALIARVLAGRVAQEYAGMPRDAGWRSDLEQARSIAEQSVTSYGLTDQALKLPVKDGKVIVDDPATQKEIQLLMEEGEARVRKLLRERWPELRLLAIELMKKGHLERSELDEILARGKKLNETKLVELKSREGTRKPGTQLPTRWRCVEELIKSVKAR